jgi:3-oxoacyl-[acyl-carrier protein] reductase
MKNFETIKIGEKAEIIHTISGKDIQDFVELTGDDNKLHVDPSFAAKTVMKKPVAHGMLSASFISTIIGTKLPGDGALWFAQNLEFLLPVRIGDTITVKAEVIRKIERDKIIELQTDIFNQHKQKITTGSAKVKIIEPIDTDEQEKRVAQPTEKTALIIGSTGGIGSAIAVELANQGFDIALHYFLNENKALEIKAVIQSLNRKSTIYKADIRKEDQVKVMVESVIRNFKTIDVLVNCATIKVASIRLKSLEWEDIQAHIDIQIKGIFNLVKNIVPIMEQQKHGKLINLITQAVEMPNADWIHYITAKAGLSGFSKALAMELAPKGITVNMISPGMTETDLIADIPEKARLLAAAKTPLRRIARPQDIACAVGFLSSENAGFITGETIRINGGQLMV